MNLELIPLLIIALLLLSAGGAEVDRAELVMEGEHAITEHRGALIVGDADVTIPADATVTGPIYLIGGEVRIEGIVDGDVTQLSGSLVVTDGGAVGGELLHLAGTETLADGASIAERSVVEMTQTDAGPVARYTPIVLTSLVMALVGGVLARRRRALLENVSSAAGDHPVISLTVGALLFVTFLSVFVFMAFTLILIPVTVVGLVGGLFTIAYGVIAWGYRVGSRLSTSRIGLATAMGVIAVMAILQVVTLVPIVGDLLAIGLLLSGLGAVVITFYGLRRFEPVSILDKGVTN